MTNAIQVHGVRKNHAFNLHVKAFLKEIKKLIHYYIIYIMLYQKKNKFTIRNLEKKNFIRNRNYRVSNLICHLLNILIAMLVSIPAIKHTLLGVE